MKRLLASVIAVFMCVGAVAAIDVGRKVPDVVIYTSMEDFRNDALREQLSERFGDLTIDLQYLPSGNSAAKFRAEGAHSAADLILDLEYGHLNQLSSFLADLSEFGKEDLFLAELLPANRKFFPLSKFGVGILVNRDVLAARGLPMPRSYTDLTDPVYHGQISMPSPKASGTAYGFVKGMVNLMGFDEALSYFDRLDANIIQYTSSGSGPVNNLIRGECAVGIGMIFQGVQAINRGSPIEVADMEGGVPYNVSGFGIVKGKEKKAAVRDVFCYLVDEFLPFDKKYFLPEQIFNEYEPTEVENFPELPYIDMRGIDDTAEKERILNAWKF